MFDPIIDVERLMHEFQNGEHKGCGCCFVLPHVLLFATFALNDLGETKMKLEQAKMELENAKTLQWAYETLSSHDEQIASQAKSELQTARRELDKARELISYYRLELETINIIWKIIIKHYGLENIYNINKIDEVLSKENKDV